jgi:hypothetical protein
MSDDTELTTLSEFVDETDADAAGTGGDDAPTPAENRTEIERLREKKEHLATAWREWFVS